MKKIFTFALLLFPAIAQAEPTLEGLGYDKLTGNVNLGSRSIKATILGFVNIALGFLGILTTIIILYGGFKWMTSYGASDKVDEAKKLIQAGFIGLVIVLSAYSISRYVLMQLCLQTTAVDPNFIGPLLPNC